MAKKTPDTALAHYESLGLTAKDLEDDLAAEAESRKEQAELVKTRPWEVDFSFNGDECHSQCFADHTEAEQVAKALAIVINHAIGHVHLNNRLIKMRHQVLCGVSGGVAY